MKFTFEEIIAQLHKLGSKDKAQFKAEKFGILAENSLGIYQRDLNEIAKQIGKDNQLAVQLFESGIYEARILCSKIFKHKDLTEALMEQWVVTFENWEICDSFCMGFFSKSKFASSKIFEWSHRSREFEKRAAFATMASYCSADKNAPNSSFEQFFPLIAREAKDDRIYVKKGVNWALRSIGKRNSDLNKQAIQFANDLLQLNDKTATWIAKDALKELQSEQVRILEYPRSLYRKD